MDRLIASQMGFLPLVMQRRAMATSVPKLVCNIPCNKSPYAFGFYKRSPSELTVSSKHRSRQDVEDGSAGTSALCRLVEGQMKPRDIHRLSAAERGALRFRLTSLHSLASVQYKSPKDVRAATTSLAAQLHEGRIEVATVMKVARSVGAYIAWISAYPVGGACSSNYSRRSTPSSAGTTPCAGSPIIPDELVFEALMVMRSAVYALAYRTYLSDPTGASAFVRLLLAGVETSIAKGAVPLVPLMFLAPTGSSFHEQVALEGIPGTLRSWLSTAHSVLYSLQSTHLPVSPLDVAQRVSERTYSSHATEPLTSIVRVAAAIDVIFHSQKWSIVGDTYTDLLGIAQPPTSLTSQGSTNDLPPLVVTAETSNGKTISLFIPPAVHSKAFQTMSARAPVARFLAWVRLSEGYFEKCGVFPKELKGRMLVATASSRFCHQTPQFCTVCDNDRFASE